MQAWYFNHRIILSTAFLLRLVVVALVVVFYPAHAVLTDSVGYMTIAHNMHEYATFSTSLDAPIVPDMMRTPLYPSLLYIFEITGSSKTVMLIVQLFVSFLSCYYVIKLTRQITGNEKTAALAGWFMALDVLSIVFTGFILTETIFTFLLVLFLWQTVLYLGNNNLRHLWLASVLLALAMLCRPIALFLPVWIVVCFLLFFRKIIPIKHLMYFIIPVLVLTGGWITRNYLVFEKPFFSRIGTFNFAWFQASMTKAEADHISLEDARWDLFLGAAGKMKTDPANDPVQFYSILGSESRKVIMANPGIALKNMATAECNLLLRPNVGYVGHLLGLADLRLNMGTERIWQSPFTYVSFVFQLVFLFLLYIGCVLALLLRKKLPERKILLLLWLIFLYFLLPGTGPEMEARFRIPLLPMLSVFSATGWIVFINRKKTLNE